MHSCLYHILVRVFSAVYSINYEPGFAARGVLAWLCCHIFVNTLRPR